MSKKKNKKFDSHRETKNKQKKKYEKNILDNKKSLDKENDFKDNSLNVKPAFEERYKQLLGEKEYACFIEFSEKYIKKTIRVNTLKISVKDLKKRLEKDWILTQVPWCKEGFWIEYRHGKRYDIGNIPEHQMGYIYVQDASSMLPPIILSPDHTDIVLDMCAAPGSKTSQLAQYMENTGLLIANDSQGKRLSALGINIQRCGVHNTIITKMDGERIRGFENTFDKILVDAPCSGTGTIRRNYKIMEMWSSGLIGRMSKVQYKLAKKAFSMLKPGGVLVYSTCTLEPEENEGIVSKLLNEYPNADIEEIKLNINRAEAITEFNNIKYDERVKKCLRIYPQNNDSEGFFVAKIRKTSGTTK